MKKAIFAVLGLAAVLSLLMASVGCASPGAGPSIQTDKPDYQPEEIVTTSGTGFSAGPVALTVTRPDGEIDEIPDMSADSSGSFTATYQLDGILGTYIVNATDSAGQTAQTTFTDGANSVTVGSQSGPLTYGTSGSVTYPITVDGSGAADVTLSISGLPAGASESFSPNPISGEPGGWSKTSTLTIHYDGTTPADTYPFTVSAGGHSGGGTLTIGGGCVNYWHDVDGDGHGAGASDCLTSPPSYQYATNGDDCDDDNPNVWNSCGSCDDSDNDGWYLGCDDYDTINGPDCDDDNPNVWNSCGSCVDSDGDGWYVGCDDYDTVDGPDCDDDNLNVWVSCCGCDDWDDDGWYVGCDDYDTINGPDCDDTVDTCTDDCATDVDTDGIPDCADTCIDADGDDYGSAGGAGNSCLGPDYDDNNPDVHGGGQRIVPEPKTWYVLRTSSTEGGAVTRPRWGIAPYLTYYRKAYYAGEVVTLEATPDAGYRFVNWTGDVDTVADVNAALTTITMNGFYEITANFEAIT
jgi:hypothetical protein